jgi:hypothetical protein
LVLSSQEMKHGSTNMTQKWSGKHTMQDCQSSTTRKIHQSKSRVKTMLLTCSLWVCTNWTVN